MNNKIYYEYISLNDIKSSEINSCSTMSNLRLVK
jgi:hypothetical protein